MTELNEVRFCPSCGHEGNDFVCPVCHDKMESLEDEVNRIAKMENDKQDIFDDISLESERDKEGKKESQNEEEAEDL